jgi:hypothetical protein
MLAMSVKSVPGCFVLIEPRLIGVPVAAWPVFDPHDEVLLELLLAVVELDPPLDAGLEVLLELLLLPQAASAAAPMSAANAMRVRRRIAGTSPSHPDLRHVTILSPSLLIELCRVTFREATCADREGPAMSATVTTAAPRPGGRTRSWFDTGKGAS